MQSRQYFIVVLFALTGCIQPVKGQQIIHFAELISERDGLNDLVINDVITDTRGVLWIATENGLNRLINNEFELFHEFSPQFKTAGHAPGYNVLL